MNEDEKKKDGIVNEENGTSAKAQNEDAVKKDPKKTKDPVTSAGGADGKKDPKDQKESGTEAKASAKPAGRAHIKDDNSKDDGDDDEKEEPAKKELPKIVFEPLNISKKTAVIIASAALLIFLALFVSFSSLFRIKSVEIVGNYAVSDEEILQMADINEGDFIFRFDWLSVASSIEAREPYIRNISFHSVFPSRVRIVVEERAKIAYISMPDGYAAVDEEGIVLEFCGDSSVEVHPVICGIECDHAVLGHKLEITNTRDYQKMIIVLGAVLAADRNNLGSFDDYSFFENLQEVRIIPSGMIFLTIRLPNSSTVQVKLNDINTITDQMNWLIRVVGEGKLDDQPNGVLDMTGEENIFRPYE